MDKEFIMATAKTIEQQILWSITKWEYLSWGISKKVATEYEGMATLALRVSGAVHKGWVFISLNEGKDCYEVRLLNVARTKVKRTLDEVYCDNLGQVLDGLIERKTEWTDEQYKKKAARDSARKLGMEVLDTSKNNSKTKKTMAKNEVKYRPATMAEIEGRGVNLYMNGEQVWVMMICRSEAVGEGEAKVDYIMLTNMKKVQVEDLQVIDNDNANANDNDNDNENNSNNIQNSSTTMKLNLSNNNETKNAAKQQVTNGNDNGNGNETIVKQVDVMGLMGALSRDGHAKLSDHVIEDAEAVEVKDEQAEEIESVNVGEVTLATIMPKMTAAANDNGNGNDNANDNDNKPVNAGRTKIVVAGVPRAKADGGSKKADVSQTSDIKPQTSTKAARYAVQLLPSKSGGVWPKLYGFRSEKEAKAVAEKMPSSVNAKWDYGVNGEGRETKTRHWYLSAGKRYCDVMQELADALNKGDRVAVANAAAKACGVYAGVVAENKSKSDAEPKPKREKKQETKAKNTNDNGNDNGNGNGNGNDNKPAAPAMSNEEQAMFDLFKKFMAGDKEAVAMVNAMKVAA